MQRTVMSSVIGSAACLLLTWMVAAGCGDAEGAGQVIGPDGGPGLGGVGGGAGGAGGETASGGGAVGGSSAGGAPAVSDPYQPPAGQVATWTETLPPGGLLDPEVLVYYPPSPGPGETLPLVVFAHEVGVGEDAYAESLTHIAKFGYVVASVEYHWNPVDEDHHAPADWMLAAIDLLTDSPPAELVGVVDTTRIAAGGHGLGGKAAIWLALESAPIDAVFTYDPIDDQQGLIPSSKRPSLTPEMMDQMVVPALYLGAELGPEGITECTPRDANACRFFEATPAGLDAWLMILESFGHMQFVDGYNCVACLTCNRGPQSEHEAVQVVARGLTVSFLEYVLKGNAGYLPYLQGFQYDDLRTKNRILDSQEEFEFCAEQ